MPIVVNSTQAKQQKEFVFQEQILKFSSTEEYLHYVTHFVNNVKQSDGRIYFKMDNGVLNAHSVSPYAEKFWMNIEPGVKGLVELLNKKRYLTYSSCEGHGSSFRRYVGLAFCDEDSRKYVVDYIANLNICGVKTKCFDSVCNMMALQDEKTSKPKINKINDNMESFKQDDETFYFNVEFHRSYDRYYFMEIIILDVISYDYEGFFIEIKKFFLKLVKKYFWNRLTNKLTEALSLKDFKKYRY